jgi:soluble lytic murein transglycosylase
MLTAPRRLVLIGSIVIATVLATVAWVFFNRSTQLDYRMQEVFYLGRFHRYDDVISQAAQRYGVSPSLVKAVIWRETRFQPDVKGTRGERGLMQITEAAAADWVKSEKIETFVPTDLFDPKTNIEAGTWYLARALKHWAHKDDPIPFALAEYNAGRTRVRRWEKGAALDGEFTAANLKAVMDFPATKQYLLSIIDRYRDYLARGEFGENPQSPPIPLQKKKGQSP